MYDLLTTKELESELDDCMSQQEEMFECEGCDLELEELEIDAQDIQEELNKRRGDD